MKVIIFLVRFLNLFHHYSQNGRGGGGFSQKKKKKRIPGCPGELIRSHPVDKNRHFCVLPDWLTGLGVHSHCDSTL